MKISCFCFCVVQALRARPFAAKSGRSISETFQGRQECPLQGKICLHSQVNEHFCLEGRMGGPQVVPYEIRVPNFKVLLKHTPLHAGGEELEELVWALLLLQGTHTLCL